MSKKCRICKKDFTKPYKYSKKQWADRLYCSVFCKNQNIPILSEETRKKMSVARIGKRLSNEIKQKISQANKGKKPYVMTEKIRRNMSLASKGRVSPMKGKHHSVSTKQKISISHLNNPRSKEFYKEIGLKGAQALYKKQPTSIEKIVYEYLTEQDIIFETQKLINGRFVVDAYIPLLYTVIEVDGAYWHSLDRIVKKDKAENAYLTKCGYRIIRLSENEVRNGSFHERMVR